MAREKGMGNLQREKSGRWTMRVGINGKRYCRSTRTKDRDQAERELQRFLAPFGRGERRLPLADVWLEYVKSPKRNELSRTTMKGKQFVWMHFAKWMEHSYLYVKDLAGVTADMIAEYLACLRVDVCASTYNARVCVLREMFRVLSKKAGLDEDPWEGVRLRPDDSHSRRELTMDELRRLLDAAKKSKPEVEDGSKPKSEVEQRNSSACSAGQPKEDSNIHCAPTTTNYDSANEWYKLILIGIYTGLRLGDCCRLDWSNINLANGVIQIVPTKTKRHHQRMVTIPIHQALGQALLGQSDDFRVKRDELNKEGSSFPTPDTRHQALSTNFSGPVLPMVSDLYQRMRWRVSQELGRIFTRANITMSVRLDGRKRKTPEATFHSLRHTFVSFAANAGVPLHVVQSIVGHESTAMTRHYYHENLDALKSAVASIPTL